MSQSPIYERRVKLISEQLETIHNFPIHDDRSVPQLKLSLERFGNIHILLSREPAKSERHAVMILLQPVVHKMKMVIDTLLQTEKNPTVLHELYECKHEFEKCCSLFATTIFTWIGQNWTITNGTGNPYIVPDLFS